MSSLLSERFHSVPVHSTATAKRLIDISEALSERMLPAMGSELSSAPLEGSPVSSSSTAGAIPFLPLEIIYEISTYLSRPKDLYHLSLVSTSTWPLLAPHLFRLDAAHDLHVRPNTLWHRPDTALMWASRTGTLPTLRQALAAIRSFNGAADVLLDNTHRASLVPYINRAKLIGQHELERHSLPPLILAAQGGHLEAVRLLLAAGADPDIAHTAPGINKGRTHNGAHRDCRKTSGYYGFCCRTGPIAALEGGHVEIVKILIEGGASPATRGRRLMELVVQRGDVELLGWILDRAPPDDGYLDGDEPLREIALTHATCDSRDVEHQPERCDHELQLRLIDACLARFPRPMVAPHPDPSQEPARSIYRAICEFPTFEAEHEGFLAALLRRFDERVVVRSAMDFTEAYDALVQSRRASAMTKHVLRAMVETRRGLPRFDEFLVWMAGRLRAPGHCARVHAEYLDEEIRRSGVQKPAWVEEDGLRWVEHTARTQSESSPLIVDTGDV
jgi:hypothetical protein